MNRILPIFVLACSFLLVSCEMAQDEPETYLVNHVITNVSSTSPKEFIVESNEYGSIQHILGYPGSTRDEVSVTPCISMPTSGGLLGAYVYEDILGMDQIVWTYAPPTPQYGTLFGFSKQFSESAYISSCKPSYFIKERDTSTLYNFRSDVGEGFMLLDGLLDMGSGSARTFRYGGAYTPQGIRKHAAYQNFFVFSPSVRGIDGSYVDILSARLIENSPSCSPILLPSVTLFKDGFASDNPILFSNGSDESVESYKWSEASRLLESGSYRAIINVPTGLEIYSHIRVESNFTVNDTNDGPPVLDRLDAPTAYGDEPVTVSVEASDDTGLISITLGFRDSPDRPWNLSSIAVDDLNGSLARETVFSGDAIDLFIGLEDEVGNTQNYTITRALIRGEPVDILTDPVDIGPLVPLDFEGIVVDGDGAAIPFMTVFLRIDGVAKAAAFADEDGIFQMRHTLGHDVSDKEVTLTAGGFGIYAATSLELQQKAMSSVDLAIENVGKISSIAGEQSINVTVRNVGLTEATGLVELRATSYYEKEKVNATVALGPGESETVTVVIRVPGSYIIPYGSVPVNFQAEVSAEGDGNDLNNLFTRRQTVFSRQDSRPNILFEDESAIVGIAVNATLEVSNTGLEPFKGGRYVITKFTIDDDDSTIIAEGTIPPLRIRESLTMPLSIQFDEASSYSLETVVLDDRGVPFASGQSRNYLTVRADAPLVYLWHEPPEGGFLVGVDQNLTVKIENVGPRPAVNITIDIYDRYSDSEHFAPEDHLITSVSVDFIGSGETVSVPLFSTASFDKGAHSRDLVLRVPGNAAGEKQTEFVYFFVHNERPDIGVNYLDLDYDGPGYMAYAEVTNYGTEPVDWRAELAVGDVFVNSSNLTDLPPGDWVWLELPFSFNETGDRAIRFSAVMENDADRSDNSIEKELTLVERRNVSLDADVFSDVKDADFYLEVYGLGSQFWSEFETEDGVTYSGWVPEDTLGMTQNLFTDDFSSAFSSRPSSFGSAESLRTRFLFNHSNQAAFIVGATEASFVTTDLSWFLALQPGFIESLNLTDDDFNRLAMYACASFDFDANRCVVSWRPIPSSKLISHYSGSWYFQSQGDVAEAYAIGHVKPLNGRTTNLSNATGPNLTGIILERQDSGAILFTSSVDVSRIALEEGVLDLYVTIEPGRIAIADELWEFLSVPARLTFKGITIENPVVHRNGVPCPVTNCTLVSHNRTSGELVVDVTGFSTYEVVEPDPAPVVESRRGGGGGGRRRATTVEPTTSSPITIALPTSNAFRTRGGGTRPSPDQRESSPSGSSCSPSWSCTWSACIDGQRQTVCVDTNRCGATTGKPAAKTESCVVTSSPSAEVLVQSGADSVTSPPLSLDDLESVVDEGPIRGGLFGQNLLLVVGATVLTVIVGAVTVIEMRRKPRSSPVTVPVKVAPVSAPVSSVPGVDYVVQARAAGLSDEQIRENLRGGGWDDASIDKAFGK